MLLTKPLLLTKPSCVNSHSPSQSLSLPHYNKKNHCLLYPPTYLDLVQSLSLTLSPPPSLPVLSPFHHYLPYPPTYLSRSIAVSHPLTLPPPLPRPLPLPPSPFHLPIHFSLNRPLSPSLSRCLALFLPLSPFLSNSSHPRPVIRDSSITACRITSPALLLVASHIDHHCLSHHVTKWA